VIDEIAEETDRSDIVDMGTEVLGQRVSAVSVRYASAMLGRTTYSSHPTEYLFPS